MKEKYGNNPIDINGLNLQGIVETLGIQSELKKMEQRNPSLSEIGQYDYINGKFIPVPMDRVGVDFTTNQPTYRPRREPEIKFSLFEKTVNFGKNISLTGYARETYCGPEARIGIRIKF